MEMAGVDIFLANSGNNGGNQLFLNDNQDLGNNWIKIKTTGTVSNHAAIGARVILEIDEKLLVDEISGGSGYASQNSMALHFGLGQSTQVDRLTIKWPSGIEEVFENLEVNQTYRITENESITSTEEVSVAPVGLSLLPAFPNPFEEKVTIPVSVEKEQWLEINILNQLGQPINIVYQGTLPVGESFLKWNTSNVPSGIYFLRMQTANGIMVQKLIKNN